MYWKYQHCGMLEIEIAANGTQYKSLKSLAPVSFLFESTIVWFCMDSSVQDMRDQLLGYWS